jgi:PEGA domain
LARTTLTVLIVPSVPKTKIVAAFGKRVSPVHEVSVPDATMEFAAETAVAVKEPGAGPRSDRRRLFAGVSLAIVAIALITAGVYWKDRWQLPAAAAGGSLRIESDPARAEVRLNGVAKGTTPLSLSVPAGSYSLTVQHGSNIKELPVSVTNGATTVHHITWADTPAAAPLETGHLSVATDPPGSDVAVDGEERGVAPLTLRDLPVGQHRVVVRARGTTYTRTVQIEAGATASLFFGATQAAQAVVPGSIAIASPVPVQVFEDSRLIGTSEMDRIMMPAGEHVLELAADAVGFRATRTVNVTAGQTVALSVDLPRAPLSINALPWAEVFIDGARIGETPIGNLPQTLGSHEIVFRHPQLGERRVNALVTLKETNRISIDMRQR